MISFTDLKKFAKGTCNVILSNVDTGDIYLQTNKISAGSITPSTNLNEIRAGLGNPIAAMIPSDSQLQVDFDMADFDLWAKNAQMGGTFSYAAPVMTCQTVTASGTSLSIDVSGGVPVPRLGASEAVCYVQEVGASSSVLTDNIAYPIDSAGAISGFTATASKSYKVWFFKQKNSAQKSEISSLIDPMVVRFEAQIAVFANSGANVNSTSTRIGWIYVTIPYLKLQGDGGIVGDQTNADTTKISGQAIAYDPSVVSGTCSDCDTSTLGYYVYAPDDDASSIRGLAVMGGVTEVAYTESVQLPVSLVMANGSLVTPADYGTGFTYVLDNAPSGTTISASGVITAGSTAGDCDCTITYTEGSETFSCVSTVSVVAS